MAPVQEKQRANINFVRWNQQVIKKSIFKLKYANKTINFKLTLKYNLTLRLCLIKLVNLLKLIILLEFYEPVKMLFYVML